MPSVDLSVSRQLLRHLDASPTPYHAVAEAAALLDAGGFTEVGTGEGVAAPPGRGYVRRGGALVAWSVADHHDAATGLRVIGAHTDSPNLRIKPLPDTTSSGWRQLGVEIYGGFAASEVYRRTPDAVDGDGTVYVAPVDHPGELEESFDVLVVGIVRRHSPDILEGAVKTRMSRANKYMSVTVTIRARDQDQLDSIYLDLNAHERVLMAL